MKRCPGVVVDSFEMDTAKERIPRLGAHPAHTYSGIRRDVEKRDLSGRDARQ